MSTDTPDAAVDDAPSRAELAARVELRGDFAEVGGDLAAVLTGLA